MEYVHYGVDFQGVIASGAPFEDEEFPPTLQSVFDPADYSEHANLELY